MSRSDVALAILRNELRMFWRTGRRGAVRRTLGGVGFVLATALMHVPAFFMVSSFVGLTERDGGAEFACLFATLFLAVLGLQRSLEVLYNRGDLPFLLASPAPARVVLGTRLATIAVTTLLGSAPVLVALIDAAWLWVEGRWAFGFLAWVFGVLLVAPLALLVTIAFVERFGARRARTAIQALGLLLGVGIMLLMQMPQWLASDHGPQERFAARAAFWTHFAWPPLTWLAAAAHGDPRWLGVLAVLALAALSLASIGLARAFTAGAQSAASDLGEPRRRRRGTARTAWHGAFRGRRGDRVARTELRLLWRDPLLIARCSMQIVALLPMLVGTVVVRQAAGFAALALLAPAMVAVTLAALMNANDDAHEFVAASPLSRRQAAMARAAAAATPTIVLGLCMAAVLLWQRGPLLAAMTAVGTLGLSLGLGWLTTCTTPLLSAAERARQRPPRVFGQSVLGMLLGGLATGGIGAVDADAELIGGVLFAIALGSAALLFLVRPRPVLAGEDA